MSAIEDNNNRANQNLVQFKRGLREYSKAGKFLEWFLQKIDDINVQVVPTDYLKLYCPDMIGNTALHLAYDFNPEEHLRILLDRGADFTIQNQDNLTILHTILRSPYKNQSQVSDLISIFDNKCVSMVLSAHLKTRNAKNPCDSYGMSHFHIACMANNVELVEFYLDNKVFIDHAISYDSPYFAGFTGLHLAVSCCSLQVTKLLIQRGANIELKNAEQMTAFHLVLDHYSKFTDDLVCVSDHGSEIPSKSMNIEIAKLLLENIDATDTDGPRLSCLYIYFTLMDSSETKRLFVQNDINHSINVNSPVWAGYTALHFAALVDDSSNVVRLMKEGANLFAMNANGKTPLDFCIERYSLGTVNRILSSNSVYQRITFTRRIKLSSLIESMKDCRQLKIFLDKYSNSARIAIPMDSTLWPGFTPLHLVVLFSSLGNYDEKITEECFCTSEWTENNRSYTVHPSRRYLQIITELHNKNAKIITAQDSHGRTALHLAFSLRLGGKGVVVDFLLNLYSKIISPADLVDTEDLSLLHIACSRDNPNLVEKLLSHSKNVNLAYTGKPIRSLMETGWTPLHVAVAYDKVSVVNILLKYGADVHKQDVHGLTPIHLIVLRGSKSAAVLLSIQNLKDCVVKDIGLSHLHVACFVENVKAAKRLLNFGADVNLTIVFDKNLTNKSFELSRLIEYSRCTPLHMTQFKTSDLFSISYSDNHKPKTVPSKIMDLLFQSGADIFATDSEGLPLIFENLQYFVRYFEENSNLQSQVETMFGLTKVHLACFCKDFNWLKNLLSNGANVNKQLSMNLPEWGGDTPLHIAMRNSYTMDKFVKLLIRSGADVTILNAYQQTPLHMPFINSDLGMPFIGVQGDSVGDASMLLKAQKDFSINPVNKSGISHLHIACNLGAVNVVKKLIERCNSDVNQTIDFFHCEKKFCVAGFTPLHVAAMSGKNGVPIDSRLKIVDLLLKHGADPNAQCTLGKTPLHVADSYEIFERIARDSADLNPVNIHGDTPLGFLLSHWYYSCYQLSVTAEQIINRLRSGMIYNGFNTFNEEGYIGKSIHRVPFKDLQNMIKVTAANIPQALKVDQMGRTIIHNVVSTRGYSNGEGDNMRDVSIVQYASLIELLANAGFDIDSQDNFGRTALHLAVKFRNLKAISALLMVGADVNILDKNGKTVLAYHDVELCKPCQWYSKTERFCEIFEVLAVHVLRLLLCQLEVSQINQSHITNEFLSVVDNKTFHKELRSLKKLRIKPYELNLWNFISETDAVARYPTMAHFKQDAIDEFFGEEKIIHFREKFSRVAGLCSLQYRKAVKRPPLIEKATRSLDILANFPIPQLCSRMILEFFSNSDLNNLIGSTNNFKSNWEDSEFDISETSSLNVRAFEAYN